MNHPARHWNLAPILPRLSALLWGALELLALARSRWSRR